MPALLHPALIRHQCSCHRVDAAASEDGSPNGFSLLQMRTSRVITAPVRRGRSLDQGALRRCVLFPILPFR
jgi:hypothetical protein